MANISCLKCKKSFNGKDKICATKCGHLFHKGCLNLHHNRCPKCGKCLKKADTHEVHFSFDDQSADELKKLREEVAVMKSKIEELPDMNFKMQEQDRRIQQMQSELDELRGNADRRRTVIKENRTVIICDRYEPTSMNVNLALGMASVMALASALLPMWRR